MNHVKNRPRVYTETVYLFQMSPYVVSNEVLNRKILSQYHVYKNYSLSVVWVVSGGVGPRERRGPPGGRIWSSRQ